MDKKIAFFTEMPGYGKIERNHINMKTMEAWICALNAQHIPILSGYSPNADGSYSFDLGIVVVPKNWFKHGDQLLVHYVENIVKKTCKKVAVMQEGPHIYFQDYSIDHQFGYHNILSMADFLLCHNEYDVNYFKGLTGKNVYPLQSLMITDLIRPHLYGFTPSTVDSVMIGGNFVSWYGGFDSYVVAKEMEVPIYAPSMGRKLISENNITDINYLEYVNWVDWMKELRKVKYAVHLMRTYAAGTFALNCAIFGIPCIGYENLDTQRILHPLLTVKEGDVYEARKLSYKLSHDKDFYGECVYSCCIEYENHYREDRFLNKFDQILVAENI
jgi:hypothetical protein